MKEFKTTILSVSMCDMDEPNPATSDHGTVITIMDEGAGAFIHLTQSDPYAKDGICLTAEEIRPVMIAAQTLLEEYILSGLKTAVREQ